ncbi:MAG: glycerate kinase [Caproiciproducens sp.]|nr:glycerate kinase [Caproiciproducens sp.]
MKKVVLIPDSFKGTMSSGEICGIMKNQIEIYYPQAEVVAIPVADGGEGSVDAFLTAMGGRKVYTDVKGPYMEDMEAFYGVVDSNTAIVELAVCAGLPLVENNRHPDQTTTYGVGQLMVHAATHGCSKIIVGIGGSCTNDLGTGAAAAAGVKFYDKAGNLFVPTGGTLCEIDRIDLSGLDPALKNVEIVGMCDIDNPLYGENGAAYVFAPQKGADENLVRRLDEGLRSASKVIKEQLNIDVSQISGAGAAGGVGGGMVAFFGAGLQMGIEVILNTVGFDRLADNADLIISGEGKMDTQSLNGKVVIGVARRAKRIGVPLVAVVGDIGDGIEQAYQEGVSGVFSINRVAVDFKEAKQRSQSDLALTMNNLMRFLVRLGY